VIDAIDVELRERFAALVDDADDSDWFEVRPPQRSLRTPLVIAAALALTVAVAAPAVGLPHRIVRLFSDAKPAPSPVAKAFAGFDQLTGTDPAATPREVLTTRTGPGETRRSGSRRPRAALSAARSSFDFGTAPPKGPARNASSACSASP
jgi:hypothetical protein